MITGEGKGAKKTKAENIGKMRETLCGYYGTNLRQVLMAYVGKAALEGDGTVDVTGLIARLDDIEYTLKNLNYAGLPVPKAVVTVEAKPAAPVVPVEAKPVVPATFDL
jgi:hypothetical protein